MVEDYIPMPKSVQILENKPLSSVPVQLSLTGESALYTLGEGEVSLKPCSTNIATSSHFKLLIVTKIFFFVVESSTDCGSEHGPTVAPQEDLLFVLPYQEVKIDVSYLDMRRCVMEGSLKSFCPC